MRDILNLRTTPKTFIYWRFLNDHLEAIILVSSKRTAIKFPRLVERITSESMEVEI